MTSACWRRRGWITSKMNLTKETYTVSRATLEQVLSALDKHWYEGEGYHTCPDDEVRDAYGAVASEIERQQK